MPKKSSTTASDDIDYDPANAQSDEELILDDEATATTSKKKKKSSKKSSKAKKDSTAKKRKRESASGSSSGPASKKKKTKKKSKKASGVSVSTAGDDGDEGLQFDQPLSATTTTAAATATSNEAGHVEDEFDSIMESAKVTGGKNANKEIHDRLQKAADDSSRVLVERMKEAAVRDEQLLAEGRGPAINKVRMCQEVKRACSKRMMQSTLLSDGLLEVFALWLTRGGQMSELPNLHIRTTILDILLALPLASDASDDLPEGGISVDDLRASGIGKFVKYLAMHPNETPSNKQKANQIVQKWSRLIHNLSDNYSNLARLEVNEQVNPRLRQSVSAAGRITDQTDPYFSTRARVPRKEGFDFIRRPESKVVRSKNNPAISERQQQLQRKLNEMKRRGR